MNNLINKGVAVAVIFLFIGLAFAPSVNANMSEIKEYQYEDCDCISESDSNVELQDKYPKICNLLFLLNILIWLYMLMVPFNLDFIYLFIGVPIMLLADSLECSWAYTPYPYEMINNNYTTEIYKTLLESK